MDKLIAFTLASYIVTVFVYFTMDTSIFETAITPANHWIPEVFTVYFFGMFYARFLPKITKHLAIANLIFWQIFPIPFYPELGWSIIIPTAFATLLLATFCLGYRKGENPKLDKAFQQNIVGGV